MTSKAIWIGLVAMAVLAVWLLSFSQAAGEKPQPTVEEELEAQEVEAEKIQHYVEILEGMREMAFNEEFAAMMEQAGLVDVQVQRMSFGAAHLYCGRVPMKPT